MCNLCSNRRRGVEKDFAAVSIGDRVYVAGGRTVIFAKKTDDLLEAVDGPNLSAWRNMPPIKVLGPLPVELAA